MRNTFTVFENSDETGERKAAGDAEIDPEVKERLDISLLVPPLLRKGKELSVTAEERLAAFLVSLAIRFRQRGFSGTEYNLSMSRSDIGNYLGLAVETVSRLFTRFQEEGLLNVERKHIELIDLEALRTIVNSNGGGESRHHCR